MSPSDDLLNDLVSRIRRVVDPVRIVLFGSSARGTAGPDSDLDVLVVVKSGLPRREIAMKMYREMVGLGQPVDLVVVHDTVLEKYATSQALIYEPALREGKELYAA